MERRATFKSFMPPSHYGWFVELVCGFMAAHIILFVDMRKKIGRGVLSTSVHIRMFGREKY
jgi:hypothetical protein